MPGYEVKFIHPLLKRHKCLICFLAMRNPVQTECGHLFCKDCLEVVLKMHHSICPLNSCKEEITQEGTFPDNACRKEILKLEVSCNYQSCLWVGPLKDLEDHLTICDYCEEQCRPTTYPGCTKDVPIQQLQGHEERLESARNSQRLSSLLVSTSSEEEIPEIHSLVLVRHEVPEAYLQHDRHELVLHAPLRERPQGQETQEGFAERAVIVMASPSLAALLSLPGLLVVPPAVGIIPVGTERQYWNTVVVWRVTSLGRDANSGLQSTTFLTARYEAYLRIQVHKGDTGRRVYLSLFLVLMRRESELPPAPPFRQCAVVQLIDNTHGQQLISKFIYNPPISFSDEQHQAIVPNTLRGTCTTCVVTLLQKHCTCVQEDTILMFRVTL